MIGTADVQRYSKAVSYKRGPPQAVSYPTGTSESATVNDIGLVTSVANAAGYVTGYGYDAIGRLNGITPPAGFTGTTLTFAPAVTTDYGLPAGHWVHTITQGGCVTQTYLDALWRPVMTRTFDTGDQAVVLGGTHGAAGINRTTTQRRDILPSTLQHGLPDRSPAL